jgi:hypothetical protein
MAALDFRYIAPRSKRVFPELSAIEGTTIDIEDEKISPSSIELVLNRFYAYSEKKTDPQRFYISKNNGDSYFPKYSTEEYDPNEIFLDKRGREIKFGGKDVDGEDIKAGGNLKGSTQKMIPHAEIQDRFSQSKHFLVDDEPGADPGTDWLCVDMFYTLEDEVTVDDIKWMFPVFEDDEFDGCGFYFVDKSGDVTSMIDLSEQDDDFQFKEFVISVTTPEGIVRLTNWFSGAWTIGM